MPALFYGRCWQFKEKGRHLYNDRMHRLDFFNSFRIDGLAPYPAVNSVANIWHWRNKKHTIVSWHEALVRHEQTVFIPGLLDQREALELARQTFNQVLPSPIIFRFRQDYHEVLLYD